LKYKNKKSKGKSKIIVDKKKKQVYDEVKR